LFSVFSNFFSLYATFSSGISEGNLFFESKDCERTGREKIHQKLSAKNQPYYMRKALIVIGLFMFFAAKKNAQILTDTVSKSIGTPLPNAASRGLTTRYLFIVTTDGFRWQEMFGGADSVLLFDPASQALNTSAATAKFWAATPETRRHALLPFLWSTFARDGQLYGNRSYGNKMDVTNWWAFSYPGYNEMFTGRSDNLRIFSNKKIYNPNQNVLEFFQKQPPLRGKVAVFTSWDAFPYILNARRAGIPVSSGKENRRPGTHNLHLPQGRLDDPFTWTAGFNYVREQRPHVIYIALNATDLLGHTGHYPAYLDAAHRFDEYLGQLWTYIQQDSMYRNKSTLLITTDHGRGGGTVRRWMEHNRHLSGSKHIWLGILGPDTPPLGEVRAPMQLWQKQFAQTAAYFLGLKFHRGQKR